MYSWKERLADWWNRVSERWELRREAWVHIGIAVVIALSLTGAILGVTVSRWNADLDFQAVYFDRLLLETREQQQADYQDFQANITEQFDDWGVSIDNSLSDFDGQIVALQTELDQQQSDLDRLTAAHLTGEFSNYALHAMAVEGGNFTANVHLHYSPGIGNSTDYAAALNYFYTGVNWTMKGVPNYVCQPSFNGTAWGITEVWFNIGSFVLMPEGESVLPVVCTGLNTTWAPNLTYVELFRLQ